jgi:metabotropic glutamate receptor 2/3/metabotropic glutamate receptor 6/7/8
MILITILLLQVIASHESQVENETLIDKVIYDEEGIRIRGIRDLGDIMIGGLIPITSDYQCSSTIWKGGMQILEAMLYAVRNINKNSSLLPNVTIGYEIRDTCTTKGFSVQETIDMVITQQQTSMSSCQKLINNKEIIRPPITAVVGPLNSVTTAQIAGFLSFINITQVSYGATTSVLDDQNRYNYFFRTIPPDSQLATAIVDVVSYYNWNLISIITSKDDFGKNGDKAFRKYAKKKNICIDMHEQINEFTNYTKLIGKIMKSKSSVFILFATRVYAKKLLIEFQKTSREATTRDVLWISSTSMSGVNEFNKEVFARLWEITPSISTDNNFHNHWKLLTPTVMNQKGVWFANYYQRSKFQCLNDTNCAVDNDDRKISSFALYTIDAVYAIAYALDSIINKYCQQPVEWDPIQQSCVGYNGTISGEILRNHLTHINFVSPTGNKISFDYKGNLQAKYNIANYQKLSSCSHCSNAYRLVNVGHWDGNVPNDHIVFYPNVTPQFGVDENGDVLYQLQSQCQQCSPGFIKQSVISSCCGTCRPCLGQNYTNSTTSSTQCDMCPQYMWGNSPLNGSTECIDIQESYLMPQDPWAIVLMILAIIGLLSVVFVSSVFIWFWSTPIVKSSGREQMTLIMIGIILTFASTIVFILKPSPAVCALRRIGSWSSLALILSALLVKLIRLTRIFLQKEVSGRPKCVGPWYQVLFTLIIWSVEFLIIVISLIVSMTPSVDLIVEMEQINNTMNSNDFPLLGINCASEYIAIIVLHVVYLSALIITSNALAILTIRFPANFNEAKFVAFSTFTVGLVWIASIATYFSTDVTTQSAVISFGIQLSSMCIIIGLFGGRVCMMIFFPSKNVKDKYYIGSTVENKPNEMARPSSAMLSANMIPGLSSQRNSSLGNTNEIELQEKK